ncbi:hypothetical protein MPLSOD_340048 [Mesorhizobium sp. SOD10]|nr:hypothetical protein MPLSOD_340048 [Mesorhizobium sp. SOD10]
MPELFDIVALLWLANEGPRALVADPVGNGLAVFNRPLGATAREYAKTEAGYRFGTPPSYAGVDWQVNDQNCSSQQKQLQALCKYWRHANCGDMTRPRKKA